METRPEHAPDPPFDPAECMRHTARQFVPYVVPLHRGVEAVYFAGQLQRDAARNTRLPDVEAWLQPTLDSLHGSPPTEKQLAWLGPISRREQAEFGPKLLSLALSIGQRQSMSPKELAAAITGGKSALASFDAGNQEHGWKVVTARETEHPWLVMPWPVPGNETQFAVANLNTLYEANPGMVTEEIVRYHAAGATERLAHAIRSNLSEHQLPGESIVPAFLRALAAEPDPNVRAATLQQAGAFMAWMAQLPTTLGHPDRPIDRVQLMQASLRGFYELPGFNQTLYLPSYLVHQAQCPGQPPAARQEAQALLATSQALQQPHNPPDIPLTRNQLELLAYPPVYDFSPVDARAGPGTAEPETAAMLDFLAATANIDEESSLLQALQEQLPGVAETLEQFRQLNNGTDSLNRIINQVVNNLSGHWDEPPNLAIIKAQIGRTLWSFPRLVELKGVRWLRYPEPVSFVGNQHLSFALPLLVIKRAQAQARQSMQRSNDTILDNVYQNEIEAYNAILAELTGWAHQTLKGHRSHRLSVARHQQDWKTLKEQSGITAADMATLAELVTLDEQGRYEETHSLYTHFFNVLYLAKQGQLNVHALGLRELFITLFARPRYDTAIVHSVWNKLQQHLPAS